MRVAAIRARVSPIDSQASPRFQIPGFPVQGGAKKKKRERSAREMRARMGVGGRTLSTSSLPGFAGTRRISVVLAMTYGGERGARGRP